MAETAQIAFNRGGKNMLSVVSDRWGVFGPTFKMDIQATAAGDGLYKIRKADWDATIGPIFERMSSSIQNKDKLDANKYRAIANGYLAMGANTDDFHVLLQSFSAAADPAQLRSYTGTPETNSHLARLTAFVDCLNGPEQAVLIDRNQLQALADAGRRAMEYATESKDVSDSARDFYRRYLQQGTVYYSNGLIRALS